MTKTNLLSCPTEVLSLIAEQCNLQDSTFRDDEKFETRFYATNDAEREDPYDYIKFKSLKWYGNSTRALGSTCSSFRKLCLPFLFKTLTLSKATSELFHQHIKKQHGESFGAIVFNVLNSASAEEATKHLLLTVLEDTPNVTTLKFNSVTTVEVFQNLLPHLPMDLVKLSTLPAEEAILRSAAGNLAQQIKMVIMKNCGGSMYFLKSLPNLSTLDLSWTESPARLESCGVALACCSKLTSITLFLAQPHALRIPSVWNRFTWLSKETLTTLDIEMGAFGDEEWRFLSIFANHLELLCLDITVWQVASIPIKVHFDALNCIVFRGKASHMPLLLQRIVAPRLDDLRLIQLHPEPVQDDELLVALEPFKEQLKYLKVSFYDSIPSQSLLNMYNEFFEALPATAYYSFSHTAKSPIWYRAVQKEFIALDEETSEMLEEADDVLEYAKERLEQARKLEDSAGLGEWMRWMAPLAARRTLEEL